jgi:predicted RNA binding protein YcfA (HicA-like mRNA interferase family)
LPKRPGVSHKRAIRVFRQAGFWIAHEGSHTNMSDGTNLITIPRHDSINAYTMAQIVKGSGMTIAEFKKRL